MRSRIRCSNIRRMSSDEPPLELLPLGGPPNGMKPGNPPIAGGLPEELDPLELPALDVLLDRDRLLDELTLILECIAPNADCTADEFAPFRSTTRTVRFASRAASSREKANASICRNNDSLADTISLFVRVSVVSNSLIVRAC